MSRLTSFFLAPFLAAIFFFELDKQIAAAAIIFFSLFLLVLQKREFPSILYSCTVLLIGCLLYFQEILSVMFYPVAASAIVSACFFVSFYFPPCIVLRIAKNLEPDLPEKAQSYCKKVNLFWAIFILINCLISLYTVLYTSEKIWALYNGLISYLLIGLAMLGEYALRIKVKRQNEAI